MAKAPLGAFVEHARDSLGYSTPGGTTKFVAALSLLHSPLAAKPFRYSGLRQAFGIHLGDLSA